MKSIKKTWWKEAVVYQIYPRSFYDSNNDGIGDLKGIIEKLDYIKSLGVDIIWLCPIYQSPNDDNGYDISDYYDIMTEFGTMEDFDQLLGATHQKGMKLIMDLVANHTSDEHNWFEESKKSKDSPFRDYYIWKPGQNGSPPNNWTSFFSGSTWEYDDTTDEYYLHYFTKKQPDLNWENPKVREEMYKVVEFWFEKGIDGFRMDVISLLSKDLTFGNAKSEGFADLVSEKYSNGPRIHEFLQEMNKEVLSKYDIMTVGEGPGISLDTGRDYVAEDRNELNMVFHFDHMFMDHGPGGRFDSLDYDLTDFKRIFGEWDEKLKENAWGSIFLGNHDFSRIVSRFGNDGDYHSESAKLLATMLLSLRGTVYVYQGEEIGMTNVKFDSIDDYRDVELKNGYKEAIELGKDMDKFMEGVYKQARDNARTPMQWDGGIHGGFSQKEPWIKSNPNASRINVALQDNDDISILNFYREMIRYRKNNPTLVYGDYKCLNPNDLKLYVYERWDDHNKFMVLLNFSEDSIKYEGNIPESYDLEMNNYLSSNESSELRPWEAKIFRADK